MADVRDPGPEIEIVVRFARTADPISGRMSGAGSDLEFDGWLGLVRALERVLEADRTTEN